MSDESSAEVVQSTPEGGEIGAERVTCTKYGGKHQQVEGDYAVEVYDKTVGREVTVICCESCKDEFAEWVDSDKIRELSVRERWDYAG